MGIYFLTATISYISMFFSRLVKTVNGRISIIFALLSFLALSILSGLRFDVGTDFFSYYNYIDRISTVNIVNNEYGLWLLGLFIDSINAPNQLFIIVTSFLVVLLIFLPIKKESSYPEISILLLFGLGFYFTSLNIVRQYLAIALIFYATIYYIKDRKKLFVLFVFIATLFHTTAVIAFSFLFLYKMRNSRLSSKLLILLGFILISFFYDKLLGVLLIGDYSEYAGTRFINEGSSYVFFALFFLITLLLLLFQKQIESVNVNNKFYILLSLVGVGLAFMGTKSLIIMRVAEYFTIFNIILLADFLKSIKSSHLKVVAYIWLIFLSIIGVYLFLSQNLGGVVPYRIFIN
ncbi:EpsG family protein [Virgibacillus halodenitrificans]|uniref:EpsG family protein n=1 Tax=Virgibacillus halodenitrificans TaxID=1482 RepID=UPI002DBA82B1|nr:EpsG family protein [Virgibacillus halodenitrificans]MEC2159783.1 EpsG family protein [Virgibacillus halodenitrificans]